MSNRKDDFHLIHVGDKIINWDRVDYVQYRAEKKDARSRRPALIKIFFGSSDDETLILHDSEASDLYTLLAGMAVKVEEKSS